MTEIFEIVGRTWRAFSLVWGPEEESASTIFDWDVLVPTIVGGLMTLIAALVAFLLTYHAEKRRRHIDELKVGPSAGLFVEPERLKLSEYKFLMSKENFGLADDIILAEQRALNTHHLYKMYSEMHLEMQAWMDEIPGLERSLDGVISTDAIPKTHILQAEMRVAQLNRLIVGVVESLEGDIAQMINLTNSFLEVAHDLYGPYFPKIKFS